MAQRKAAARRRKTTRRGRARRVGSDALTIETYHHDVSVHGGRRRDYAYALRHDNGHILASGAGFNSPRSRMANLRAVARLLPEALKARRIKERAW